MIWSLCYELKIRAIPSAWVLGWRKHSVGTEANTDTNDIIIVRMSDFQGYSLLQQISKLTNTKEYSSFIIVKR